MSSGLHDFFQNFKESIAAGAEVHGDFELNEFATRFANELEQSGVVDGFEACHYRSTDASMDMRVDGYWPGEDGVLTLFLADFASRESVEPLGRADVAAAFKCIADFFKASLTDALYEDLAESSPVYGLARLIAERGKATRRVDFYLLSERAVSGRHHAIGEEKVCGVNAEYHVWDMMRLFQQGVAAGQKEALEIDFKKRFKSGVPCLRAYPDTQSQESYLVAIPATMLADLYEQFGTRLLEQNVRTFLQARGKVNKGIQATLLNEPEMFFAYNNGISATAKSVKSVKGRQGLEIVHISDLQIVNGGQTTATLFHTRRKKSESLEDVFVQMKLSIVPEELTEEVVPRISEYANTQNRVNAADFFSNHPFHRKLEECSRRIWAPVQQDAIRKTRWFYERARGQYADEQSTLDRTAKREFQAKFPKAQMFAKTDLAKFENAWDDHPVYVNRGAQKNFAKYAQRIGREWDKAPNKFNDYYFQRVVARALIFRHTERLVSSQSWYDGGYRANIVAYAIALIKKCSEIRNKSVDFIRVWNEQAVPEALNRAIEIAAKYVYDDIHDPPEGISNISEWCKKEGCWDSLLKDINRFQETLPSAFWEELVSQDSQREVEHDAKKIKKIDDGIIAQQKVVELGAEYWLRIEEGGKRISLFTDKELGALSVATKIPKKIPSEKQCFILLDVQEKARLEGIV